MHCPNCGREMTPALEGEEKAKDAEDITYKIVLNEVIIDEALERHGTKGGMIFKGKCSTGRAGYKCL